MDKSTISTGPFSSSQTVSLPEGNIKLTIIITIIIHDLPSIHHYEPLLIYGSVDLSICPWQIYGNHFSNPVELGHGETLRKPKSHHSHPGPIGYLYS